MSRFLGPIHHWLFNKIVMFEEIEKNIIDNAVSELGISKEELLDSIKEFPQAIGDQSLESIIDTNNIHGWLQNKISIAETRQAKLITFIVNKYPEKGRELILNIYKMAGESWGQEASGKYEINDAPTLYKIINNYVLDGMPCDNVNNIVDNESDLLTWRVARCLHKDYWLKAGGDIDFMYDLREALLTGFIKTANPKYQYSFDKSNGTLDHKIFV